jgi:hypothetical protein
MLSFPLLRNTLINKEVILGNRTGWVMVLFDYHVNLREFNVNLLKVSS